jgi:hypothetical protein
MTTRIWRASRRETDRYKIGSTVHAPRFAGGGGPDGHYWTVLSSGRRADEGAQTWQCWANARPATDAEVAALVPGMSPDHGPHAGHPK